MNNLLEFVIVSTYKMDISLKLNVKKTERGLRNKFNSKLFKLD